jgi:hypothetical protein
MNKKIIIPIAIVAVVVLIVGGVFTVKSKFAKPAPQTTADASADEDTVAAADPSIAVTVKRHPTKDNTVVLTAGGLGGKYTSVAYELSYDSNGVVQGVTSKPVDVAGQDTFTRDDIYLGTCSKNVCTPHKNVSKITVILEFTAKDGKKSELSKDFDI